MGYDPTYSRSREMEKDQGEAAVQAHLRISKKGSNGRGEEPSAKLMVEVTKEQLRALISFKVGVGAALLAPPLDLPATTDADRKYALREITRLYAELTKDLGR